jgi:hypothetical protein
MEGESLREAGIAEVTAHLCGEGPLLAERKPLVLRHMLFRALLESQGLAAKSLLEQELEAIECYNEEARREGLGLPRIRYE